jgi:hypothetical protein
MWISGSFCCLSISLGDTKEHCRFHLVPRFQEHFLFELLLVLKARPVLLYGQFLTQHKSMGRDITRLAACFFSSWGARFDDWRIVLREIYNMKSRL